MKRRNFLRCLGTAALVRRSTLGLADATEGAKTDLTDLPVHPDERIHVRIFPPPPITEVREQLPHRWLTAFEDMEAWKISVSGLQDPKARRCKYRPLFHESHVEVTWEAAEHGKIILTPPQPLKLPSSWNAVDFWVGGHPTDFVNTPWFEVTFYCLTPGGGEQQFEMCEKNWLHRRYAVDMFHRLVPKEIRRDLQGGALKAIEIRVPKSKGPYPLELYALTFYDYHRPRHYQRPAKRPFPTAPDGVAPTPTVNGTGTVEPLKGSPVTTVFSFRAADGSRVVYTYTPKTGSLDDLTVSVNGEKAFCPCAGGGVVLESGESRLAPPYPPSAAQLIERKLADGTLTTKWKARVGDSGVHYSLSFRLVNRSLIIEAEVEEPAAVEFRIGYPDHAGPKRPVEVPMLTWFFSLPEPANEYYRPDIVQRKAGLARSPAILLAGDNFMSAIFDWYVSDASFLYPLAERKGEAAGFDGGAYYLPPVDSPRNALREKLILTVSKEFQDTLPNIPNPPSPFLEEMKERVYVHGDIGAYSVPVHKNLGITHVATLAQIAHRFCDTGACRPSQDMGDINDWIEQPSRLKGGADRVIRRAEEFRALGWLVGTYVNYALMNPMFPVYAELPSAHDIHGFHRSIWNGSTIPAQGEAIAYARRQLTKMKSVFGFQVIYADQTTAYTAYDFTDYTPGVAGAAKFREAYEQIAQLYLTIKEICQGPTYSEGGPHWTYSGLVDGNLARTQHLPPAKWPVPPPADVVDFHLRKINPLSVDCCSNDYYDDSYSEMAISQTLAYGKIGLWWPPTGQPPSTWPRAARAYFVHHHAQRHYRNVPVEKILYHNGTELVDTTTVLKQGKERLGRIYTRYQNSLESWINLNAQEPWTVTVDGEPWLLPPYGWIQRRREAWGTFLNYSVARPGEGRRLYVEDDGFLLLGAPGTTMSWPGVETDGTVIIRRQPAVGARVINLDATKLRARVERLALSPSAKKAVVHVLDLDGTPARDLTVPLTNGWLDFSFLANEQFALVYP